MGFAPATMQAVAMAWLDNCGLTLEQLIVKKIFEPDLQPSLRIGSDRVARSG
jgi:hypothetical protein